MNYDLAFPVGTKVAVYIGDELFTTGTVMRSSAHHKEGAYVEYDQFTMSDHGLYGMKGSNWGKKDLRQLSDSKYMELFL
jgi:hypothetical protein